MVRRTDANDQLERKLAGLLPDLLVEDGAREMIHLDELDFHRRETQVVDVRDSVAERTPLAGERDPRGPKPDHE